MLKAKQQDCESNWKCIENLKVKYYMQLKYFADNYHFVSRECRIISVISYA